MAEMPRRPRNHALETKSRRLFEAAIPDDWVVTEAGTDYGVDLRVEIFEDGSATGLQFNVQLKATDGDTGDRWPIKRQTLNYWEALPSPTLLAIAHAPTETVRYLWLHLYAIPSASTRSVVIKTTVSLTVGNSAELATEVRAFKLARELWKHVPLPVKIAGDRLNGMNATPIKREIRRLLRKIPSLTIATDSETGLPFASVQFLGDRVEVAISGTLPRPLSWGGIDADAQRLNVASDILAAIGVAAGSLGAADLGAAMFRLAAPESWMIAETVSLPDIIRLLAQTGNTESILILVRRTAAVENHPSAEKVLGAVLLALRSEDHKEIIAKVGWTLRDSARKWEQPARSLYNAAGLLASADPLEAIKLYDASAAADHAYLQRGYWWWEKGRAYWKAQDATNAEICYRKAVSLDEKRAEGPLADVLLRTGRFTEAKTVTDSADFLQRPDQAQWRLTTLMLDYVVDDLKIADQNPLAWETTSFQPGSDPEPDLDLYARAVSSLHRNAMDCWAYGAVSTATEPSFRMKASISAAICSLEIPMLWVRVIEAAMEDGALDQNQKLMILQDALFCAWAYSNDEFKEAIEDDPFIPDQLKQSIIRAFDDIRPGAPVPEIRVWNDETGEQIFNSADEQAVYEEPKNSV